MPKEDIYGRTLYTDKWDIFSWRYENDTVHQNCHGYDPYRLFHLKVIPQPVIPSQYQNDERFSSFTKRFKKRYELIEEWASLENPDYLISGKEYEQIGRDKTARIASFDNWDEGEFILRLLVAVLNAPADSLLCREISPFLMKAFTSFPDELAKIDAQVEKDNAEYAAVKEQAELQERKLVNGVHVYIFSLNNGTVKIGMSNNVIRRARTVIGHSGLDIIQWCSTDELTNIEARQIEADCHRHFANRRIKGEFFNLTFDEACVYLQSKVKAPLIQCKGEVR